MIVHVGLLALCFVIGEYFLALTKFWLSFISHKGTTCPSEFEEFQGNCYFLNHDARVAFDQANIECQSRGAAMASIHSVEEQLYLAGMR